MIFKISTTVNTALPSVKEGFNEDLFVSLNPPFPRVILQQFDGCSVGDIVSLELDFVFFRQVWTSEIVNENSSATSWEFIDEGRRLPFFVKSWRHIHRLTSIGKNTLITDHVTYSTGSSVTDWLVLPMYYLVFLYRKPIYKRTFKS